MSPDPPRRVVLVGAFGLLALIASLTLLPPPAPSEAQTAEALATIWSGTLTVDQGTGYGARHLGCEDGSGGGLNNCGNNDPPGAFGSSQNQRFVYDGTSYGVERVMLDTTTNELIVSLVKTGTDISLPVPAEIVRAGRLSIDGADYRFAHSIQYNNPQTRKWSDAGLAWTVGQTVSMSLHAPLPDRYSWCAYRMSLESCLEAIARWAAEAEEINLPASGHCPATHAIRTATSSGIVCEQTFHDPIYGSPRPLEDAWGVGPVIAPPTEIAEDDPWDGSTPRSCFHNFQGAYVLKLRDIHGLSHGCHYHDGALHEHATGKHCATRHRLDHWNNC